MSTSIVQLHDVALAVAGVSCGVLALIVFATIREAARAPRRLSEREETFAELVALTEAISTQADGPVSWEDPTVSPLAELAHRFQAHLVALPANVESIEMVNHLLSLDTTGGPVSQLIRESPSVRHWITAQPDDDLEHQISALQLIAEVGDSSFLPRVLIASGESNVDLRRAGLRAMSAIAPERALNAYFRAVPNEGAWALERLTQVVRQPGALDAFVSLHGNDHVAEMIGVLGEVLVGDDERSSLAAIDTLAAIDHPSSAAVLLRTARSGHQILSGAALDALTGFAEGREALRGASDATHLSTDQLFSSLRQVLNEDAPSAEPVSSPVESGAP